MAQGTAPNPNGSPSLNGPFTTTDDLTNFFRDSLDVAVRDYRPEVPRLRGLVDTRPVTINNPGDKVQILRRNRIPLGNLTPLNELEDVTPVVLPDANKCEVQINEHGMATVVTKRTKLFDATGSGVNGAIVAQVADHQARYLDALVRQVMDAGTNRLYLNGGSIKKSGAINATGATDIFSSALLRKARAQMVADGVPFTVGTDYTALVHPSVSADLRGETGAAAWRQFANLTADTTRIEKASIGEYEGWVFVEDATSTVRSGAGAGGADVFQSYLVGGEALVEAVAEEAHSTVSPQTDHLGRFFGVGWYAALGHALYEPTSLINVFSGSEHIA